MLITVQTNTLGTEVQKMRQLSQWLLKTWQRWTLDLACKNLASVNNQQKQLLVLVFLVCLLV